MKHIQGVIFDLDGVIVDTAKYHFIAWKRLANELGVDFDETFNEQLKGVSRIESLNRILKLGQLERSPEEKEVLTTRKNSWYLEHIDKIGRNEILPGVENFLQELKSNGYKICLGSASRSGARVIELLGLESFFHDMIDGNRFTQSKPHPEVFLKGAESMAVAPNSCVVFEDSLAGVEAAKAGGMFCIGVGDGAILKDAHFTIKSFEEMTLSRFSALN
ncbi:MAG: beta-phosphoglucomutase [Salibacteraceae bacterium]